MVVLIIFKFFKNEILKHIQINLITFLVNFFSYFVKDITYLNSVIYFFFMELCFALNAFKNASEMDFIPNIKEDAWLNYAKLSYEIGNPYQSIPEVLSRFLKLFPKSAFKTEVESLLIDSYISSNNYKEALLLLTNKSKPVHKAAYQKVTFFRALELYNEANYSESLILSYQLKGLLEVLSISRLKKQ